LHRGLAPLILEARRYRGRTASRIGSMFFRRGRLERHAADILFGGALLPSARAGYARAVRGRYFPPHAELLAQCQALGWPDPRRFYAHVGEVFVHAAGQPLFIDLDCLQHLVTPLGVNRFVHSRAPYSVFLPALGPHGLPVCYISSAVTHLQNI